MKRKYGGRRKAGQDHDRLAVRDGQAERLSRFERDAVGDNARVSQLADDVIRHVPGSLAGAAG